VYIKAERGKGGRERRKGEKEEEREEERGSAY